MYQTGTLLIEDFLNLINFPDTISTAIEANGYPANQCGGNVYQFTNQFSGSVVPFFSHDTSGNVYFAPTTDDADGIYPIRLYIAKANYDTIFSFYDFSVEITLDQGGPVQAGNDPSCSVTFDLNGANVDDIFHLWGSTEPTETDAFAQFIPVSTCNDILVFYSAEIYDEQTSTWVDLPSANSDFEISFDANKRCFFVEKCSLTTSSSDPECSLPAYTKMFQVRVVATANNYYMNTDRSLTFDVVVGPDCSGNEVSALIPMSNLDYQLRTGPITNLMDSVFK